MLAIDAQSPRRLARRRTIATRIETIARRIAIAIAIASAIAVVVVPSSPLRACDPSTQSTAPPTTTAERDAPRRSSWPAIVAGCLGVLFGGAIAVWQIRGRASDRRPR